jgi:putative ABC transport system ATP-binding protein
MAERSVSRRVLDMQAIEMPIPEGDVGGEQTVEDKLPACFSTGTESLLQVTDLFKSYRLGQRSLPVLEGLSLDVKIGELVVIMGPSGSGKSTLLNCLSAIDVPDAGSVSLAGTLVDYDSEKARTALRRERVGIVFQFFNLIPTLSVRENILLPLMIRGKVKCEDRERADQLLIQIGLESRGDHLPSQLSGGEMQLTSIARALIHGPELLLADEPTGNVNPRIAEDILETLAGAAKARGVAILMVTHSAEHAAWADRVCFLKDGQIAAVLRQGRRRDQVALIHDYLANLAI